MRASSSDKALACPRSLVQLGRPIPTKNGEDSRSYGTAVHYHKETGEFRGSDEHIALLKRKIARSGFSREEWWPAGGVHEVTFAVHLETAELTMHKGWGFDADAWKASFAPRDWLTGTIDWYVPAADGKTAWIDDLKTGRWPVDWRTSGQLKSYAMVPWIQAGRPRDWECHASITQWPKYPLDASPVRTGGVITGFDLEQHLDDLRYAVANPHVATPELPAGGELGVCAFCPNREEHPATEWMTNWKFSRLPTCWEGALGMLQRGQLTRSDDE